MSTFRYLVVIAAGLMLATLAACGGGGGGGGGGGAPAGLTQPPSTPVAVTVANATQVAATALEPAIGGGGALGAIVGAETTAAPKPRALTRTLLAVARDSKRLLSAPPIVVGVVQTFSCIFSGSVTVDDQNSNGTSATITFNACSDVAGETISGSASVTGISVAPDGSSFSATFSLDVTFTATGFAPLRIVGGFSISETCNLMTLDCTGTFTGTSLGANQGTETWFITNFTITSAELVNTTTITFNYTVSSTALNGSVTVITSTPLQMLTTAQHPHAGVVVATGSLNSSVRVTVIGSHPAAPDQLQIEVDADGIGGYESVTLYSWSTLDAL